MSETRLPIHPYAELFPPMGHPEFDRLCGDIAVNGLQEPIVLHEGKVLEGRNRYLACLARRVPPYFREYAGECGSPLAFIVARNLYRRHLTESQRALVGAKLKPLFEEEARQRRLAGLKRGDTVPVPTNLMEREKLENNAESAHKAAELMKVSATSVRAADKVQKQGVPELVEAVAAARLAVSAAARIAGLPAEQQRQVLLQVQSGVKPTEALARITQARPEQTAELLDEGGLAVPEPAVPAFQQRKPLRALCRKLQILEDAIPRLAQSPIGMRLDTERVVALLQDARRELLRALPAHVCPGCRGTETSCNLCHGHGWVTAAILESFRAGGATVSSVSASAAPANPV